MNYEKNQTFVKKAGISRSKLYRFYDNNPELFNETQFKKNRRLIPEKHYKYFDREKLFEENKSMRNLIDCLRDKQTIPYRFWYLDWSYFMTISYKLERSKDSCSSRMRQLYTFIQNTYGDKTGLRIFFSSEPHDNRKGYHNHLLLNIQNRSLHKPILDIINKEFKNDKVDYSTYDYYKGAVYYTSKKGLQGTDWDFDGNKLKEEGLGYEN